MSTAALILGVVSTVTAAAALGWSIAQGISSRYAAEREDARRVVEVGSLQEQVGLLRQLLRSRTEEAQTRGKEPRTRAIITARAGAESGSSRGVERTFSIRNVGDAPAIDLEVWLALDFSGEPASVASSSTSSVGSLVPGDPEREVTVNQPAPFHGGKVPREGFLVGRWKEPDQGEHERAISPATVYI